MRKPYDPIADEEPHIVAEYHFQNCTAYIADNYLRRLTPEQEKLKENLLAGQAKIKDELAQFMERFM